MGEKLGRLPVIKQVREAAADRLKIVPDQKLNKAGRTDLALFFLVIFLAGFGLIMIYSASEYWSMKESDYTGAYFKKQLISVVVGLVCMLLVFRRLDYHKLKGRAAWIIYGLSLMSMFVLFTPLGKTVNGATRWINLGFTTVQPAEFVKLGVIVLAAALILISGRGLRRPKIFGLIMVFCGVIPGIEVYLISQNMSSAIIIMLIPLLMTFVANPSNKVYMALCIAALIVCVALIIYGTGASGGSDSFRLNRIQAWLHPGEDQEGVGYQTAQSLYAIGSGGMFGKGLGKSLQKIRYIPEAQNDMIFAVICEELGIAGAMLVIFLFVVLLWRIYLVAKRAPDRHGTILAMGVFFHIAIQVFMNIAVVTNMMPNTGVTLPFISYGGSSVVLIMIEMGIVLNISRQIPCK